jgi:hypothetical protein
LSRFGFRRLVQFTPFSHYTICLSLLHSVIIPSCTLHFIEHLKDFGGVVLFINHTLSWYNRWTLIMRVNFGAINYSNKYATCLTNETNNDLKWNKLQLHH